MIRCLGNATAHCDRTSTVSCGSGEVVSGEFGC